jgi:hypothetical protein
MPGQLPLATRNQTKNQKGWLLLEASPFLL